MKVMYIYPATDNQVNWGCNDDPRIILNNETIYNVIKTEVHAWNTKYILKEFPDKKFNSVNFAEI